MKMDAQGRVLTYLRSQMYFFPLLSLLTILPIICYIKFSPVNIPYLEYAFIVVVALTQYFYFNESIYRKNIETKIRLYLRKKNNRLPSKKEVINLTNLYVTGRELAVGINVLLILLVSIIKNV